MPYAFPLQICKPEQPTWLPPDARGAQPSALGTLLEHWPARSPGPHNVPRKNAPSCHRNNDATAYRYKNATTPLCYKYGGQPGRWPPSLTTPVLTWDVGDRRCHQPTIPSWHPPCKTGLFCRHIPAQEHEGAVQGDPNHQAPRAGPAYLVSGFGRPCPQVPCKQHSRFRGLPRPLSRCWSGPPPRKVMNTVCQTRVSGTRCQSSHAPVTW